MRLLCLILLNLCALPALAETYRWSDPKTGQTIVSDTPPPGNARLLKQSPNDNNEPPLPLSLRKAAENFPVLLYTSKDCGNGCVQARDLLSKRGIPFTEKLLVSEADTGELKALVGEALVPTLKVGKQASRGFLAEAYHDLLDWAGYPGQPRQTESETQ